MTALRETNADGCKVVEEEDAGQAAPAVLHVHEASCGAERELVRLQHTSVSTQRLCATPRARQWLVRRRNHLQKVLEHHVRTCRACVLTICGKLLARECVAECEVRDGVARVERKVAKRREVVDEPRPGHEAAARCKVKVASHLVDRNVALEAASFAALRGDVDVRVLARTLLHARRVSDCPTLLAICRPHFLARVAARRRQSARSVARPAVRRFRRRRRCALVLPVVRRRCRDVVMVLLKVVGNVCVRVLVDVLLDVVKVWRALVVVDRDAAGAQPHLAHGRVVYVELLFAGDVECHNLNDRARQAKVQKRLVYASFVSPRHNNMYHSQARTRSKKVVVVNDSKTVYD